MKGLELLTSLESLSVEYPQIDEIDISKNKNLKYLSIVNANSLDEIDFSENINLETIRLVYTHLKSLNIQNCTKLKSITMGAGMTDAAKIEELDVSNCKELTTISISGNKLRDVDLSNNTNLQKVLLTNGKIKHLILPEESNIKEIMLFENRLESLDDIENLDKAMSLEKLYIQGNYITDFSLLDEFPKLTDLNTDNVKNIFNENENESENISETKSVKRKRESQKEVIEQENVLQIEYNIEVYIACAFLIIIVIGCILGKRRIPRLGEDEETEYDRDTALYGNGYDDDENL